MGSKGWRSGESTRLPPMWPRFKSWRQRHMWVEFVVVSLPCSERFFSGYSGFPLSSKTNISKFQFNQESGRRRTTLWMCYLQTIIIILYYYYIIKMGVAYWQGHGLLLNIHPPPLTGPCCQWMQPLTCICTSHLQHVLLDYTIKQSYRGILPHAYDLYDQYKTTNAR